MAIASKRLKQLWQLAPVVVIIAGTSYLVADLVEMDRVWQSRLPRDAASVERPTSVPTSTAAPVATIAGRPVSSAAPVSSPTVGVALSPAVPTEPVQLAL